MKITENISLRDKMKYKINILNKEICRRRGRIWGIDRNMKHARAIEFD